MTDNGTGNLNEVMSQVLTYQPDYLTYCQENDVKVERFHQTLEDVSARLSEGENENWDLFLNQTLTAVS